MAGLFENIGEFFGGGKQNEAQNNMGQVYQQGGQAARTGQEVANEATAANRQMGQWAQQGYQQSMGQNAQQAMQRANQAANQQASENARMAANQAAQQGVQAARGAGMNRGAAALAAAQNTGNVYSNAYQQGQGQQLAQYNQAAQQFGQQAQNANAQMGQLGLGQLSTGLGSQAQAAGMQYGAAKDQAQSGGGFLGGLGSLVGSLIKISDERVKDNVQDSTGLDSLLAKLRGEPEQSALDAVLAKIRPVSFNYKPESGEDPSKRRLGVLAQDLEGTPLQDNVEDGPDGLKRIDIGQQTLSNLNLIIEMGERLQRIEELLRGRM